MRRGANQNEGEDLMRRRLFVILLAVSLALWCRSLWRGDYISISFLRGAGADERLSVLGLCNRFGFCQLAIIDERTDDETAEHFFGIERRGVTVESGTEKRRSPLRVRNLFYPQKPEFEGNASGGTLRCRLLLPWWILSLLVGGSIYFMRKKPSDAVGLCRACGYDLRATPHRCPECGTVSIGTQITT